jgi:hypothetical protein
MHQVKRWRAPWLARGSPQALGSSDYIVNRFLVTTLLIGHASGLGSVIRKRRGPRAGPPLIPGDRVRVSEPGYWADGAVGTIAEPPATMAELAGDWHGHVRMVATTSGVRPFYWVVLDKPRLDGDGDAPYQEAEIAEASLRPLRPSSREA